jgi:hypothetical protein
MRFRRKNCRYLLSAPDISSCPVAGPVGYLFPGLTVYLVDILGKAESLAAFHAAQAGRPSPDQKFQLAFAISAFHGGVFWPYCRYHLHFYFNRSLPFFEIFSGTSFVPDALSIINENRGKNTERKSCV